MVRHRPVRAAVHRPIRGKGASAPMRLALLTASLSFTVGGTVVSLITWPGRPPAQTDDRTSRFTPRASLPEAAPAPDADAKTDRRRTVVFGETTAGGPSPDRV